MDNWTEIILETEDAWHRSAEYQFLSLALTTKEYCRERDIYKANRIYNLYGYEYFSRFIKQCPHIIPYMDDYVPCKKESQCTMFCHKYDFEKGCTLNATK